MEFSIQSLPQLSYSSFYSNHLVFVSCTKFQCHISLYTLYKQTVTQFSFQIFIDLVFDCWDSDATDKYYWGTSGFLCGHALAGHSNNIS